MKRKFICDSQRDANLANRNRNMSNSQSINSGALDRRQMLAGSAGLAALGGLAWQRLAFGDEKPAVSKGNIRQSIVSWCFTKHWSVERICQVARQLGIPSIELIPPEHWPMLKKYALTC